MQFKCLKQIKDKAGRITILLADIQGQEMILTTFMRLMGII